MKKNCMDFGTPLGPYSPALSVEHDSSEQNTQKTLYISGQIPMNPVTGEIINGSFAQQAEQVFSNLTLLLEKSGFITTDVVKPTIFLTDLANFAELNSLYEKLFKKPYPARSTVQVSGLPKGVLLEIEAVAVK